MELVDSSEDKQTEQKEESVFNEFVKARPKLWFWIMVACIVIILILLVFYGQYIIVTYQYESSGEDAINTFNLIKHEGENYSYYYRNFTIGNNESKHVRVENALLERGSFIKDENTTYFLALFFHSGTPLRVKTVNETAETVVTVGNIYKKDEIPYFVIKKGLSYRIELNDPDKSSYCYITILRYNEEGDTKNIEPGALFMI